MPTKAGLPGWFPEDFKTDPALHAAFEDAADWHAAGRGRKPGKAVTAGHPERGSEHAVTWDDLAAVIGLSAGTGRLAVTPAPYGKPGGPGLYGVHGLKHSDYLEQVVKALMRKGMDKGKATAIARGSIRKWMAKSKHPEVRAAAAGAEAEELKAQARAHAHATTWDDLAGIIELASRPKVVDLVGPHGYIHGWIYVGGPGLPSVAAHNAALRSKGVTPPTKAHPALTRKPPSVSPPAKAAPAAGKAPAPARPAGKVPAPAAKAKVPPPKTAAKAAPKQTAQAPPQVKAPTDPAEKKRLADIWSTSYRYSNKSGYTGSDYSAANIQRGKDFADEMHRLLSTNTPPESSAPGVQDAHKFLAMADHDATVQKGELQRQIDLPTADVKRMFQPGKTTDMPAASWTGKESRAGYYSSGKPGQTTVMMHTAPGAKGLSIASVVPSNVAKNEQEVVTGGRYSVDKVQVVNGITHVYVTQQGFSAH